VSNGQIGLLGQPICTDCATGYYLNRRAECVECSSDCRLGCYNQNSCILQLLGF
jgi:hypothetical protein